MTRDDVLKKMLKTKWEPRKNVKPAPKKSRPADKIVDEDRKGLAKERRR